MKRRALLSVTDKSHLEHVAAVLESFDFELLASGGTARYLRDNGFPVVGVSEVTGFPEVFGGRVKTLHPLIHGGILGKTHEDFTTPEAIGLGLEPIDVVVVNLYAFESALAQGLDEDAMVEQIDIGGPAMLRAAAKNYHRVTVLTSPNQYEEFIHECRANDGQPPLGFRRRCALAAFRRFQQAEGVADGDDAGRELLEGADHLGAIPGCPCRRRERRGHQDRRQKERRGSLKELPHELPSRVGNAEWTAAPETLG
mgnify:CR=1 FL=1